MEAVAWRRPSSPTQWDAAHATGGAAAFEGRLVGADVLLVDDLHRLAGRVGAQRGLARIVAAREQADRQVVVTADRGLDRLDGIESVLVKRLLHGVSVEIGPRGERPGTPAGGAPRPAGSLDFQGFVSDIASAVAEHVEGWKMRVAEAVSSWNAAGYRTTALERLMDESAPPENYEGVLRGFGAAVRRLKELEAEAVTADPSLAGHDAFRDPERLREAEGMARRANSGATEAGGPVGGVLAQRIRRGQVRISAPSAPPMPCPPSRGGGTIRCSSSGRKGRARRTC